MALLEQRMRRFAWVSAALHAVLLIVMIVGFPASEKVPEPEEVSMSIDVVGPPTPAIKAQKPAVVPAAANQPTPSPEPQPAPEPPKIVCVTAGSLIKVASEASSEPPTC